jgi:hypothetical protein
MVKEKKSWEEDSECAIAEEEGPAPLAAAPGPLAEKASESSTLRDPVHGQQDEDTNEQKNTANFNRGGENSWRRSEGTAV